MLYCYSFSIIFGFLGLATLLVFLYYSYNQIYLFIYVYYRYYLLKLVYHIMVFFLSCYMFYVFMSHIQSSTLVIVLLSTFTLYWLYSIFLFLSNISRSSNQTTFPIRFWRRSYILFWGVEVFLFSIYIYLIMNTPIESEWLLNNSQLFKPVNYVNNSNIYTNFILLVLFFISRNYSTNSNNVQSMAISGVSHLFLLGLLLLNEFFSLTTFIGLISQHSEIIYFFDHNILFGKNYSPTQIIYQYYFILSFLKFWHIFLISCMHLYVLSFMTNDFYLRPFQLKYLYTNLSLLFLFNNINFFIDLKYILNAVFFYPYINFINLSHLNYVCFIHLFI